MSMEWNIITSKTQRNAENACVNGMCKRAFNNHLRITTTACIQQPVYIRAFQFQSKSTREQQPPVNFDQRPPLPL